MMRTPGSPESNRLQGTIFLGRGLVISAEEFCTGWLAASHKAGWAEEEVKALNALGSLHLELGESEQGLSCFKKAHELISGQSRKRVAYSDLDKIKVLTNLSLSHFILGEPDEAIRWGEEARAMVESIGEDVPSDLIVGHVFLGLGAAYMARGLWDKALHANQLAMERSKALDAKAYLARALNNLGLVESELGNYDNAERFLKESSKIAHEAGECRTLAYSYTELGRLCFKKGDLAGAVRNGSQALKILWSNIGIMDKAEIARISRLFGSIAWLAGDRQSVLNYLERSGTYYAQCLLWREWADVNKQLDGLLSSSSQERPFEITISSEDRKMLRYFMSLLGLVDLIGSLYPEVSGRSELATRYALALADSFGMETGEREVLGHAGRLHDIGLISADGDVNINANANANISAEIELHPLLGERLLGVFPLPEGCLETVRHHHECFDGSGFPDGLAGEEIPFLARILAVADAYVTVAMGRRSGSGVFGHSEAMVFLRRNSGSRFDPRVVSAFEGLHRIEGGSSGGCCRGDLRN